MEEAMNQQQLERAARRVQADRPDWAMTDEQARVYVLRTFYGRQYLLAEAMRDLGQAMRVAAESDAARVRRFVRRLW
jgi:hypothetical protein